MEADIKRSLDEEEAHRSSAMQAMVAIAEKDAAMKELEDQILALQQAQGWRHVHMRQEGFLQKPLLLPTLLLPPLLLPPLLLPPLLLPPGARIYSTRAQAAGGGSPGARGEERAAEACGALLPVLLLTTTADATNYYLPLLLMPLVMPPPRLTCWQAEDYSSELYKLKASLAEVEEREARQAEEGVGALDWHHVEERPAATEAAMQVCLRMSMNRTQDALP